ncbi:hypothetical protein [Streptomyces poonensis]|uniref:Uncharacterized protein n=1 Tax=Streptomyces poonensis TaxID=68255 RepID=A0A918PKL0_9ACTN|nr:hypothetical protein [Streptomyces poonensis]GGZ14371.1 hypothetical protein GCM10010365_37880 [Streptomyces poonensis]GLJ93283.1 hypothetical protein GCM10017589_58950 [Streptomyces poonensis]
MPTPYGSRGAMAFGAEELRVLRRALALALNPRSASAEDVHDCLRLAESVDEAARESARLRAFLLADLARYRAALPGTAAGYLALLEEALGAGHQATPDDFAALRALRGNAAAAALLERCAPTRQSPGQGDAGHPATATSPAASTAAALPAAAAVPASRTRLTALPGGVAAGTRARATADAPGGAGGPADQPARPAEPAPPAREPGASPRPQAPSPARRPIPTPGEVFPPKRKPVPPAATSRRLVAG